MAMIGYEQFDSDVDAHFLYALGLPEAEALEIFDRRLRDGSWKRAGSAWLSRLLALPNFGVSPDQVRPRLEAFARMIMDLEMSQVPAEATLSLLMRNLRMNTDAGTVLAELVSWLNENAKPEHASLVVEVLDSAIVWTEEKPTFGA